MTLFFLAAVVVALLAAIVFPMFMWGLITGVVLGVWGAIAARNIIRQDSKS